MTLLTENKIISTISDDLAKEVDLDTLCDEVEDQRGTAAAWHRHFMAALDAAGVEFGRDAADSIVRLRAEVARIKARRAVVCMECKGLG